MSATRIITSAEAGPQTSHLRADQITLDDRVQRSLIPARLKKLTDQLDLDALGVITVSDRGNGEYVAIDGQHRIAALLANDMGEWQISCNIYKGLSLAQEAALFRRLNDTRKITAWDDYQKALVEEDPEALAIDHIVRQHGLKVATNSSDGNITCVTKLRQLYQSKDGLPAGENLSEALGIAMEAWGPKSTAVEKSILGGIAFVLRAYPEIDRQALAVTLGKFAGGPANLLGKARLMKEIRSGSVERLVASVIVGAYNKSRRRGKLADL